MYYILQNLEDGSYSAITDGYWLDSYNDTNWFSTLRDLYNATKQRDFTHRDEDELVNMLCIQNYTDMHQYIKDINNDPRYIDVHIIHETENLDTLLDDLPEHLI